MIGVEIEGRYRVESELGAGGVGTVYRAVHLKLGRPVALKVIQERFGKNRELRQRFEREARALASLSHPHIVTVTDYGVHDEAPYLVMELLEGTSLDVRLKEGLLEPAQAFDITRQLLSALEFAHETGLVHRDVKPGNVFLQNVPGSKAHVKLLDFGLARFLAPEGPRGLVTRAGQVVGTPSYMAPEQVGGQGKSPAADVYSVGILLFEMLAGRTPFRGDAQEVMRQHLLEPLPSIESVCPDRAASAELDAFLRKATAKRGAERFANAGEMARALDALPEPAIVGPGAPPETAQIAAPVPVPVPAPDAGNAELDEAVTLHRAPEGGGFVEGIRRAVGFVSRTIMFTVFAISLTALVGALGVVLILVRPEVADEYPVLRDTLRRLPGIGQLVPERGGDATRRDEAAPNETPATGAARTAAPGANSGPPGGPSAAPRAAPALPPGTPSSASPAASAAPAEGATVLWTKIPQPIGRYHKLVESSRALTKGEMVAIHRFNATHLDDPRGHLVLARSHMRRGWRRDAMVAYGGAYKTSPRALEDEHMLPDLIDLVAHGVHDAPELVRDAYGKLALGTLERALTERQPDPDYVKRLETLRDELRALPGP